ncbi:MAG: pirin family protein, partial [Acidimicrobiales bacterium]
MPAVTVDDISSVPTLTVAPGTEPAVRPLVSLTTAPSGFEGEGFPVRRAFAGVPLDRLDPFVHMDQMGEVDYGPGEPKGTPWHPHRGFETVTYMLDGTFQHRDSTGGGGLITNGATQWMTAGSGILHIERPPEELVVSGGLFHGIQLWVNLPASDKWVPPGYQDIAADRVTLVASPDGGSLLRIIAGEVGRHKGPGSTHTPITMVHATVSPGERLVVPWDPSFNALGYVLAGRGRAGAEDAAVSRGQLAVFGAGDAVTFRADLEQDSASPAL